MAKKVVDVEVRYRPGPGHVIGAEADLAAAEASGDRVRVAAARRDLEAWEGLADAG